MLGFLFSYAVLHVFVAVLMLSHEWYYRNRVDPLGCLMWPWWFARYTKRMWRERTEQYDQLRRRERDHD